VEQPPVKPRHIAIIMDGNGRWAEQRGLPRFEGHRRGVEAVREAVKSARTLDVPYLTLFSFSSENWSRPKSEILDLMGLMRRFIQRDLAELHQANVRVRIIGEREGLDADIVKMLDESEALTRDNTGLTLTVAFNYGSRAEIVRAARRIATQVERGEIKAADVCGDLVSASLDTAGIPDPDLFIRTSGEQRLSNFLLWQLAYAELVFIDTFWPDFNRGHMEAAIASFQSRERRFGGLTKRSSA
jgi:undecaprenyl diphosphate synthase